MDTRNEGVLYIVATPIGNLEDITRRALTVLAEADVIAAEDTRRTRRLLTHFGIRGRIVSYHDHNESRMMPRLLARLVRGEAVALVTDGGTPCISDPGYRIVRQAHENGIRVVPVPGVSGVIAAVSAAGLPSERFVFEGYLPRRSGDRAARWKELAGQPRAVVLYEAPHRMMACLSEMAEHVPDRRVALCRELTKLHEEILIGYPPELLSQYRERVIRGEFTVVIEARGDAPDDGIPKEDLDGEIAAALAGGESLRDAARRIAEMAGIPYRKVYQRALELRRQMETG